jgi:hypothetical protein
LVHLNFEGIDDVMPQQLEVRIAKQMGNVALPAREEVVQTDDFIAIGDQTIAQMTAQKSCSAGDENAHGLG